MGFLVSRIVGQHPFFQHAERVRGVLLVSIVLLGLGNGFGQSSFLWYFGNQAGIKFNANGTTSPLTGSAMTTNEGSTVASDTSGVLMFYSDGVSVWNNSSSTPVATGLLGSQSSTQAALALALPGSNCQRFLVFTTKGLETSGAHDLGVVLVNVSGTSPGYLVNVNQPALSVVQPSGSVVFAEKLAATSDTAGGYWVVAHDYALGTGSATTFYKYHITAAGFGSVTTTAQAQSQLAAVQQTQSVGSNHHDNNAPSYNAQGQMKFSKTGQKLGLVLAGSKIVDLYQFHLVTGNLTLLATTTVSSSLGNLYGCEFSPNGTKLYASEGFAGSGTIIRKLYQWDITAGTLGTPFVVASGSNVYSNRYKYNALQLGPNDKIYCSEEMGISFLSVIANPNASGAACNWSSMSVPVAGTNTLGLTTVMTNFGCSCLPSPGSITGPVTVCKGDAGKVYAVSPVAGATSYEWTVPAGVIITAGINTNMITVTYTNAAVSGVISVHAVNAACVGVNSPPLQVTVNPLPVVSLGPDPQICSGQTATLNAGSCPGCTFQWANLSTGQMNIGNGQTYSTGTPGVYMVNVTNAAGCIARDTAEVLVVPSLPVSVSISASANPVCSGSTVFFAANPVNPGNSPVYEWFVNGSPAGSGSTYSYIPANGDCVSCVLTSNVACASGNPYTSTPVCITVAPLLSVGVSVAASQNPVCEGTEVTYTANAENGGPAPSFQWKVNWAGIPGATNATFTYIPANGDFVTCTLTSSLSCVASATATSTPVVMVVNSMIPVTASIGVSANPVCSGSQVTFSAAGLPAGGTISYGWQVNGILVTGATSSTYAYIPADGDCINCLFSTNLYCTIGSPASSNVICINVNPLLPVSVSVTASGNPVCEGETVQFTTAATNGGGVPAYQWQVNMVDVEGATESSYAYMPANGDAVTCLLTSSENCTQVNPVGSNAISMAVSALLPVSVTVTPSANPVCPGTLVNYTASGVNGGSAPGFQWSVNGTVTEPFGTSLFSYVPADGDQIRCSMNSTEVCVMGNPAVSNVITMSAMVQMPVSVVISATSNPFCPGSQVTVSANAGNGGANPSFVWLVNGNAADAGEAPQFVFSPDGGDVVECILTSSGECTIGNPATSNPLLMVELPAPLVVFTACFDTVTTLQAKPLILKGGHPPGGYYAGPGVNTSAAVFTPVEAGVGVKSVTYTYTNVHSCSSTRSLTIRVVETGPFICGNLLTDVRDLRTYRTVQLGDQCWMQENLGYGMQIPAQVPQTDNCIPEWYLNNSPGFPTSFYQWDEIMEYTESSGDKGICPAGWHIPTLAEWDALLTHHQGPGKAGGWLKDPINTNGFMSYQSGLFYMNDLWSFCNGSNAGAMFWSSQPAGLKKAVARGINDNQVSVSRYDADRNDAFNLRCVQDQ